MRYIRFLVAAIFFAITCIFIFGCGKQHINSGWAQQAVVIDGKFEEWKDQAFYYDESSRVSVSVLNDKNNLYICLITRNHGLMGQIVRSGFIVWFDPKGAGNKVLGIRFPAGGAGPDMPMGPRDDSDPEAGRPGMRDHGEPPEIPQEPWQELEIFGPGKSEHYTTTLSAAEKSGIVVRMGWSKGYFVYELQMPLYESETCAYAVNPSATRMIGMGFEVPRIGIGGPGDGIGGPEGGMRGGPGRGGMRRGGMSNITEGFGGPGGGMGGPGGRGGMRGGPGGGGAMFKRGGEFQLWYIVKLASRGA